MSKWFALRCLRSDRKSTRLNSSHIPISYAVFCLKKKKQLKELHLLDPTAYFFASIVFFRDSSGKDAIIVSTSALIFFFFLNDRAPPEISPFSPQTLSR